MQNKDFLGNLLYEGDDVIYIVKNGNYTKFHTGKIISFTEKEIEILGEGNLKTGKVLKHRVIKDYSKDKTEKAESNQDIEFVQENLIVPCADRCSALGLEDIDDEDDIIYFNFYRHYPEYSGKSLKKRIKNAYNYLFKKEGLLSHEIILEKSEWSKILEFLQRRIMYYSSKNK